jgi:hypothetical protein
MNADILFAISSGEINWDDAIADGHISASGERSNLSELFLQLSNAE